VFQNSTDNRKSMSIGLTLLAICFRDYMRLGPNQHSDLSREVTVYLSDNATNSLLKNLVFEVFSFSVLSFR
jgi:hypothetical protein